MNLRHPPELICGLSQPPAQASPTPRTPTAAALIQSLLGASPRSASCASPMEGVPERFGPVLQPKTPSFVSLSLPTPHKLHESGFRPALECCLEGVSVHFGPVPQSKMPSFVHQDFSVGIPHACIRPPSQLQNAPPAKAFSSTRNHDLGGNCALLSFGCAAEHSIVHMTGVVMSTGEALEGHRRCAAHAQVYTPMEGVPERMGLPDISTGKRWLHAYDAADGESPIEGVKGQHGRQVSCLQTFGSL